jgi:hypothetical protein
MISWKDAKSLSILAPLSGKKQQHEKGTSALIVSLFSSFGANQINRRNRSQSCGQCDCKHQLSICEHVNKGKI